jgi:hypothetical protein
LGFFVDIVVVVVVENYDYYSFHVFNQLHGINASKQVENFEINK